MLIRLSNLGGRHRSPVPHRRWTFTIPRDLRGLFGRDRKLLGLWNIPLAGLSCTPYQAVHTSFQALFECKNVPAACPETNGTSRKLHN
jgi:hypothetical protein